MSQKLNVWLAPNAASFAAALAVVLVLALPAQAAMRQAPNSRVVLDLPGGYEPSPLFSGFQDETTGASFVILEAPASAYEEMSKSLTVKDLGKRGITDAAPGKLVRTGAYVYMQARQSSPAGDYAKFFVLFRTADQTVLVSANIPQAAVETGTVKAADIEASLSSATTTEHPAVQRLYDLSYLGPFKEAGTVVGTSKVYTLDGRMEPERRGELRSTFLVAPSLDKQAVREPETTAERLMSGLPGLEKVVQQKPRKIAIGGLAGFESEAAAHDTASGEKVHVYQAFLLGGDGGYFRLVGICRDADKPALAEEFQKIAQSFTLLR